jgi:hypothetical protein
MFKKFFLSVFLIFFVVACSTTPKDTLDSDSEDEPLPDESAVSLGVVEHATTKKIRNTDKKNFLNII